MSIAQNVITQLSKPMRMILIGAPGVGKGTHTTRLIERYNGQLFSISSGDLLRDNVRRRTAIGLAAESIMKSGNLVPDDIMLDLLVAELKAQGGISQSSKSLSSGNGFEKQPSFILDGLPRTTAQAKALDSIIPMNFVVHLQTPASIILSRIASRWIHPRSGRVYNTKFNPPKTPGIDDETGEPLVQRADDGLETWKQRFLTFEETSRPLLEVYKDKGVLWEVEGNSSDEISPKLFAEIERRFG